MSSQERSVDAYRGSLDRIAAAFTPDIVRALRDERVPSERRRAALEAATKDEPKAIQAVLHILLQRGRIAIVPEIARAFGDLIDKRAGVVHAKVTTSVPLDESARAEMVRRLEHASGKTIKAVFAVDPKIIGGARVQLGDRLIDASIAARLDLMARQLASS